MGIPYTNRVPRQSSGAHRYHLVRFAQQYLGDSFAHFQYFMLNERIDVKRLDGLTGGNPGGDAVEVLEEINGASTTLL